MIRRARVQKKRLAAASQWVSHLQVKSLSAELYRRTGIVTSKDKMPRVEEALIRLHDHYGLAEIEETRTLIVSNLEAWQKFVNEMTINESYLFRDKKLLEVFTKNVLVPLAAGGHHVRIWSAASSTGDEATTLALICFELEKDLPFHWTIDGSDIDTEAVRMAVSGQFEMRQLKDVPERLLFQNFTRSGEGKWKLKEDLRCHLNFFQHNLMDSRSVEIRYDVIFLRNVLIYFDGEKRRQVIHHLQQVLKPEGFLFLGHAETLPEGAYGWEKIRFADVSFYKNLRKVSSDE